MFTAIRAVALTFAALCLLVAFAAAGAGQPGAALIPGLLGAGIIAAVLLERTRYRSATAEHSGEDPGPGGGESGPPEPRFRPTDEVFVDPPSGRLMRVYLDDRSGERRYVAER